MVNPTLAITNLGAIVTGDIDQPLADGDTIIIRDEQIVAVGSRGDRTRQGLNIAIRDASQANVNLIASFTA